MMRNWLGSLSFKRKAALLGLGVMAFQLPLGSCQFDQITATSTVTLDGREVIMNLIRGAILTPIDTFITDSVNELFDEFDSSD